MSESTGRTDTESERLAALAAAVPFALFEATPAGDWTLGNGAFRGLAGFPPDGPLTGGLGALVDPEARGEVMAQWLEAATAATPFNADFPRAGVPDGWLRVRATPVRAADGTLRSFAGTVEDISDARHREQGLVEAAGRERDASRQKSEFLAVMSHELRTPIHGVVGTAGLLQSTDLSSDQREYVDMLVHSADATLSVINNILDLSKIEAGRLELEETDFELRPVIEKAAFLFAGRAQEAGLELNVSVDPDLPLRIHGDPERLRQVLVNLVGNAVKFTTEGEVVVRARPVDAGEDPVLVRFEVEDSGIGIDEEARNRLFEPFAQADASITRRYGGSGLGLTICRRLVEMMHGVIGVDSEMGRGSTFWFTTEFRVAHEAGDLSGGYESLAGKRLLVVDDRQTTREVVVGLAEYLGMVAEAATKPDEAMTALLSAHDAELPFDLLLVDMRLGGGSTGDDTAGRALVKGARAEEDLADLRIVLATPFGHRGRAAASRWTDIAALVAKPIGLRSLREALRAALRTRAGTTGSGVRSWAQRDMPVSSTGSFKFARILVVDDNEVNRKIAAKQLEQRGFLVDTVDDGAAAVDAVIETPYDLVFMDWMMPGVDGFEATRRIRAMEAEGRRRRVPIVALTARALEGDRELCLEPGMDDYITKPVQQEQLDSVLARWLAGELEENSSDALLVESGRLEAAGTNAPATPAAPPPAVDEPEEPPLDGTSLAALEAIQDPGDRLVEELIEIFLGESPRRIDAMKVAAAAGDGESLEHTAHSLKGSSASLGAQELARRAKVLEDAGREDRFDAVAPAIAGLEAEYARVQEALIRKHEECARKA